MTESTPISPGLLAVLGLNGFPAPSGAAGGTPDLSQIFGAFARRVTYDTTENFLSRTLFVGPSRYEDLLARGLGLSCQEQYFLLRDVLRHFGREAKVVHGDVLDRATGVVKTLFASSVTVAGAGGFWHLDPIYHLMCYIEPGAAFCLETPAGTCAVADAEDAYTCAWSDPAGDSVITYRKHLDEYARRKRLAATYPNDDVVPFGAITPFYWQVGPTRKIFYDVFADKIRLVVGGDTYQLDLLDWDMHEASMWLDIEQKKRVFRCVSEIEFNLDMYRESMSRFLLPVAGRTASAQET